ncbi:MAG: fatty acid desaturase [Moraxellaceae bacterium]|nr:fatty acid desaturase [Moraxellaceae bacterium]
MTSMEAWTIQRTVISRYLSREQVEAFGAEMDALRRRIRAELGDSDLAYARRVLRLQRRLEVGGRAALQFSFFNPLIWAGGVAALASSKILHTLELGHNVLHGQYDWTGDPELLSTAYEWKFLCPAESWRHLHNIYHHRYTNIVGKDRDIGFGLLRMAEGQPWHPVRLVTQPLALAFTALAMEWGIALYEIELGKIAKGKWHWHERKHQLKALGKKIVQLRGQDYVLFPLLAGPFAPAVLAGNFAANLIHNVWWFALIFCGHFPEQIEMFTKQECEEESRAEWYVRQILSTGNIEGGRFFQFMSGHVGHQIEHHLFPTLPAHRAAAVAPEVRALCEKYGLPYTTGPLHRQLGSALRRVVRHALPNEVAVPAAVAPLYSALEARLPGLLPRRLRATRCWRYAARAAWRRGECYGGGWPRWFLRMLERPVVGATALGEVGYCGNGFV